MSKVGKKICFTHLVKFHKLTLFKIITTLCQPKGSFTNKVYKRRWVGGQKMSTFLSTIIR